MRCHLLQFSTPIFRSCQIAPGENPSNSGISIRMRIPPPAAACSNAGSSTSR